MSSRGKNFRRRSGSSGDDDEDTETKLPTTVANAALAPPKPKPKPRPLLSFGDEEDDGAIPTRPARRPPSSQPKQSSAHKLTSAKDRAATAPTPAVPSTMKSQAGEYTEERLRELRKNTRHLGSVPRSSQLPSSKMELETPRPSSRPEAPAEPVIVLKGLVKPVLIAEKEKQPKPQQFPRDEQQLMEEEDSGEEQTNGLDSSRFAKLGINRKGEDSSLIPDQATINAIRAKRERMRQARSAAPDYISLDGSGVTSTRAPSAGGSSDEEETEFQGRIALLGDKKDGNIAKGVFQSVDERIDLVSGGGTTNGVFVDEDDEEDEEERKWEEEQFRKGLGKRLDDSSSQLGSTAGVASQPIPPPPRTAYSQHIPQNSVPIAVGVSRSAEVLSIAQQADVATRALQQNISKLKETHERTLSAFVKTDNSLVESLSNITDLEKALEGTEDKFVYMQKLRSFVSVICDFLQEKAPYIEELEEYKQKLHEDRALATQERRATDFADEMAKVEPAIAAAISILSKGSGSAYISAATNAAQAALVAAREKSNLSVQLDEFGRDLNLQKRMDDSRRAEARKRRKLRSERKSMSKGSDSTGYLVEGECSTDESDSESQAYQSTQSELLQTAGAIFSDAADEYSDLSVVKEKFEEWKDLYTSSYRDAYMALSAPDIFSPYVRVELLKWNPLYENIDFNDMEWHNLLFDYGQPKTGNFDPDDPDEKLIPELVERVALPILHHEIASCWDVLSTRMTRNAASAARLVMTYIPASEALRDFLAAVHARLEEAISDLVIPTWSTTVIKIVPEAAPIAAYQFGVAVRLLRNLCLWKDILSVSLLENSALVGLLSGKVLPHLYSIMPNIYDAVTRTERVIASLSGVWSGPDGKFTPKLQPLVDWVAELGRKLEKRHTSGVGEDTLGLARRLKKMMVDLNEYDKARLILRTFQIKEAL